MIWAHSRKLNHVGEENCDSHLKFGFDGPTAPSKVVPVVSNGVKMVSSQKPEVRLFVSRSRASTSHGLQAGLLQLELSIAGGD